MVTRKKGTSKKAGRKIIKKRGKRILEVPKSPHDPEFRHKATSIDLFSESESESLSELRLHALKHAGEIENSLSTPNISSSLLDAKAPVPPLAGLSNWVQLGPTVYTVWSDGLPVSCTSYRPRYLYSSRQN